jgi:ATP-binding cassette subfamily B protein
MTIGTMLAISYIIGQLNNPLRVIIEFFREMLDVKLSYERINEIHEAKDEEASYTNHSFVPTTNLNEDGISIENVSFNYNGSEKLVLNNLKIFIPKGKITAIVGASGSGKTTLLKLLLKFYEPTSGKISIEGNNLSQLSPQWWRNQCGAVLQDGYIFTDTIKGNITAGNDEIDQIKLQKIAQITNINEFINELPLGYDTKIGNGGIGLSTGQKQRLLIARALYKDPKYIFLDEATSSLDAQNEKEIVERLNHYFEGKTVIVIAHRLSTVKNADYIMVLNKGIISEIGTHNQLIEKKGHYFSLVKNQLELGQ